MAIAAISQVEGSGGADPQLLQGAHFKGTPDVPNTVIADQEFTIFGTHHFDNPLAVIIHEQRTVLETDLGPNKVYHHGKVPNCNTRQFQFSLMAPPEGRSFNVILRAQDRDPTGIWVTQDTYGPISVESVSAAEKQAQQAAQWAPFVAGGAVLGGTLGPQYGYGNQLTGAAGGAAAGGAAKFIWDEAGPQLPSIGTAEAVLAIAGLGASAWFLREARRTVGGARRV